MTDSENTSVDQILELREKMVEKFMMLSDGDYKISKNLEISCYNATVLFADEKGFVKKWENSIFRNSYCFLYLIQLRLIVLILFSEIIILALSV